MKTKKLNAFLFCCLISTALFSQVNHTCQLEGRTTTWPHDGTTLLYIPDEFTPVKYVKVNFHYMLKADSTLNFRPYDDGLGNCSFTAYDYSDQIIQYVNQRLSTNSQMHLPPGNTTPVLERKYRLVLEGVYFHYDDDAYTYNGVLNHIANYSINPDSEINIFFTYDDSPNGYQGGGSANTDGNRRVRVRGAWQKYRQVWDCGILG